MKYQFTGITISSPSNPQLQNVAQIIDSSRNIIAVTGAGISTSCGIPAFRGSKNGIYSKYGKYVFDYVQVNGADKEIGMKYLQMIGDLKMLLKDAIPSKTHQFLKYLSDLGKLRRVYTQNIDDLETAAGLERVSSKTDAKSRFGHKRVIQLHGHLRTLFCGVCHYNCTFSTEIALVFQQERVDIPCPSCVKSNELTLKRKRPIGKLQTSVVLQNGGPNPDGRLISQVFEIDTHKDPDLLIIIGTSLEIKDIKAFVSRLVRDMKVPTILIDLEFVEFSGCEKMLYHLKGPCDDFTFEISKLMKSAISASFSDDSSTTSPIKQNRKIPQIHDSINNDLVSQNINSNVIIIEDDIEEPLEPKETYIHPSSKSKCHDVIVLSSDEESDYAEYYHKMQNVSEKYDQSAIYVPNGRISPLMTNLLANLRINNSLLNGSIISHCTQTDFMPERTALQTILNYLLNSLMPCNVLSNPDFYTLIHELYSIQISEQSIISYISLLYSDTKKRLKDLLSEEIFIYLSLRFYKNNSFKVSCQFVNGSFENCELVLFYHHFHNNENHQNIANAIFSGLEEFQITNRISGIYIPVDPLGKAIHALLVNRFQNLVSVDDKAIFLERLIYQIEDHLSSYSIPLNIIPLVRKMSILSPFRRLISKLHSRFNEKLKNDFFETLKADIKICYEEFCLIKFHENVRLNLSNFLYWMNQQIDIFQKECGDWVKLNGLLDPAIAKQVLLNPFTGYEVNELKELLHKNSDLVYSRFTEIISESTCNKRKRSHMDIVFDLEVEIDIYFEKIQRGNPVTKAQEFWKSNQTDFPRLSILARKYLTQIENKNSESTTSYIEPISQAFQLQCLRDWKIHLHPFF